MAARERLRLETLLLAARLRRYQISNWFPWELSRKRIERTEL
jgi:hypothetical protein